MRAFRQKKAENHDQLKMIKNLVGLEEEIGDDVKLKQRLGDLLSEMELNDKRYGTANVAYSLGYSINSKIGTIC